MKGILGKKVGMTQIFDEKGEIVPVTVIEAGPCYVTQIKSEDQDGYKAVQLGFGDVKEKRLSGGERGHLGLLKTSEKHPKRRELQGVSAVRYLREFRLKGDQDFTLGQKITADIFAVGDHVDVIGTSKGKGFAGNVKRHHFAGGPRTHGQSDRQRTSGSIAPTTTPGRIHKGKRMSGHMGTERVTAQNLTVVIVDAERNLIAVRGPVPGAAGSLVMVEQARKG
jgi:large subunit ribosomal protein L3